MAASPSILIGGSPESPAATIVNWPPLLVPTAVPATSKRDGRLDFLRGLCLIVMTIDHLPSMSLHGFSYETLGFFTSAEGFVLICGITCGLVYGGGDAVQTKRILRRCGQVALTYALLTLVISMVSLANGFITWKHLMSGGILDMSAGQAGILLMYVAYLLALPLVIRQFHASNGRRLLCASFGLWLVAQWRIGPQVSVGYLLAWQFLFVTGAWIGYARRHRVPIPGHSSKVALKVAAVCCIALFFLRHPLVHQYIIIVGWEITAKDRLGIVRLLNLAVFAFLIARIPRSLDEKWGKLGLSCATSFLGRHSLQVFAWHALIVGACHFYGARWTGALWSLQILMTGIVISTLFVPAFLHEQWQTRSRRPSVRDGRADLMEIMRFRAGSCP